MLVVDDEPELREVIRIDLESAGFAVTCVGSLAAALVALKRGGFDVILSDVLMPGGGGFDLLDAFRAEFGGPPVPLVLMTGFADGDATERARGLGVEVLGKPVGLERLVGALRRVVQRPRHPERSERSL